MDAVHWQPVETMASVGKLDAGEVHVWRISLNASSSRVAQLEGILSNDELERAVRFFFERDKRRFIVGRGLLRTILGGYLRTRPAGICFAYGNEGKPVLAEAVKSNLSFNLTNCGDLALVAFCVGHDLGIDLESIDRDIDVMEMASQFFTSGEVGAIAEPASESRHARFFQFWTRKEAYIKALGRGLSIPLNEFDVTTMLESQGFSADGKSGRWSMQQFVPEPGYVAALMLGRQTAFMRWFNADHLEISDTSRPRTPTQRQ